MSEWIDFKFNMSGEISTDLVLEICYGHDGKDRYDPKVRENINAHIAHLVNFVNEDPMCGNLVISVILQCLFDIFSGGSRYGSYPDHVGGLSDVSIKGILINNFSMSIYDFIDSVMDDAVEESIQLIVEDEGVDRSTLRIDPIEGVMLGDFEYNTYKEATIAMVTVNNELSKSLYASIPVFEMLFDYLYFSGLLEDTYYRILNLYKQYDIKNYNILEGSGLLIRGIGYGDTYWFNIQGEITFDQYRDSPRPKSVTYY